MSSAVTKTPPSVFGATGKLATKLFEESSKVKNLSDVRAELKRFRDAYEASSELRAIFINPLVEAAEREKELEKVFQQTNVKTKEAQSFLKAAAATKNLGRIKQIVNDFDKLVTYELKEVHATVTSAEPLQPTQVKRLETALKGRIESDHKLILNTVVEPSILGGLVIHLDQQMLDLSVSSQIRQIDQQIRA